MYFPIYFQQCKLSIRNPLVLEILTHKIKIKRLCSFWKFIIRIRLSASKNTKIKQLIRLCVFGAVFIALRFGILLLGKTTRDADQKCLRCLRCWIEFWSVFWRTFYLNLRLLPTNIILIVKYFVFAEFWRETIYRVFLFLSVCLKIKICMNFKKPELQ